jgi:hypothetical protein
LDTIGTALHEIDDPRRVGARHAANSAGLPADLLLAENHGDGDGLRRYGVRRGARSSTIDVKSGNFNIPSAFGLSRSSFHIWTTANPGESKLDGTGGFCMLRKVGEVWPMSIWFNFKCMPMIGSAVDTRELALASLKFLTDKRTKDVGATAGVWQARPAVTAPASTVAKTPWPGFSAQAPPFRQPDRWL